MEDPNIYSTYNTEKILIFSESYQGLVKNRLRRRVESIISLRMKKLIFILMPTNEANFLIKYVSPIQVIGLLLSILIPVYKGGQKISVNTGRVSLRS